MNSNLLGLANSLGVVLSDRSCYHSHVWDGSSLALCYQTPIFAHPGDVEPIEISKPKIFSDFDLCHELAHWMIAEKSERVFPEYGLGWQTQHPYYANGGQPYSSKMEGLLSKQEQEIREARAYFLTLHLCERYCIMVPRISRLDHFDNYYTNHTDHPFRPEEAITLAWKSIIWLYERQFISDAPKMGVAA